MKNWIFATLLSALALSAHAETLRIATSATYPPFESLDANNQIVGFDIDLANALCQQMQVECTFTNQTFDALIPALKFKRYDVVIAGMDITADRQKQAAFSAPYYQNRATIIAKKGQFDSIEALQGKKIGVENGTTHQRYLKAKMPGVVAVGYDSYQNAFIDLQNGRLDGIMGDKAVIQHWIKQHNLAMAAVGEPISDPEYYGIGVGLAVRKGNDALLAKINQALKTLQENGTINALYQKWIEN